MQKHNVIPENGYVPNEETAISIAIAIWNPIYGKERIAKKSPYNAKLTDGIWYITGSLPKNHLGGVPEIEINQQTGQILRVSHGR